MHNNIITSLKIVVYVILLFPLIYSEPLMAMEIPGSKYIDEAILILILLIIIFHISITGKINYISLITFSIFCWLVLVSWAFGLNNSLEAILQQSLIHLKLPIILSFALIINRRNDGHAYQVFLFIFIINITGLLMHWALGDMFTSTFDKMPYKRGEDIRIVGLSLKPNDAAIIAAFFSFVSVGYLFYKKNIKVFILLFTLSVFAILLNGSRTALLGPSIALLVVAIHARRQRFVILTSVILILMFVGLSGILEYMYAETIKNIAELKSIYVSDYIRAIMIFSGFSLVIEYFPIGTGAATFGSVLSLDSPVYNLLGLSRVDFFIEGWGIYDSNLATISGEFGVIGLILFYFLIPYGIYKSTLSVKGRFTNYDKKIKHLIYGVIIFTLLLSITNPVFMYTQTSIIASLTLLSLMSLYRMKITPKKNQNII